MKAKQIGTKYCVGYKTNRPLIVVDTLPKFKNIGYNVFEIINAPRIIEIENFSGAENNNTAFKNEYAGYCYMTDGKDETIAYIASDDYDSDKKEYRNRRFKISG